MKLRLTQMAALLVVCIFLFFPVSTANVREWSYENYLYSFEILLHEDAVTAGRSGLITVEVGANTDAVLHLEFKGQFSWGHWVFYSKNIPIPAGSSTVSDEVNVPYKTIIEPASEFYYCVYATLPGDEWNPSAWGLTQPVTVVPPVDVTYDELVLHEPPEVACRHIHPVRRHKAEPFLEA